MLALVQQRVMVVQQPAAVLLAQRPQPAQIVFGVGAGGGGGSSFAPITGFNLEITQQQILQSMLAGLGVSISPAQISALQTLPANAATESSLASGVLKLANIDTDTFQAVMLLTSILSRLNSNLSVTTEDSSEREYAPGLLGTLVANAGDTIIYTPPAGKGWILHASYAVPVSRGTQDPPVITVKTVASAAAGGALLKTHFVWAANSSRKRITMPADARLVVNLDIAGPVPTTFDIEVLP